MEPFFSPNDKKMFYNYLDNASIYCEFGCGGSTYQASIRDNIKNIFSIESDKQWIDILKQKISSDKVNFMYNEMDTVPDTWGYPGINATDTQKKDYSSQLLNLDNNIINKIDLILIDGRFRVACCLKCYKLISDNCLIIFDDFLDREHYHIVLDFFDIIDKTIDNKMVVLRKKKNKLDDIINKYILDTR